MKFEEFLNEGRSPADREHNADVFRTLHHSSARHSYTEHANTANHHALDADMAHIHGNKEEEAKHVEKYKAAIAHHETAVKGHAKDTNESKNHHFNESKTHSSHAQEAKHSALKHSEIVHKALSQNHYKAS